MGSPWYKIMLGMSYYIHAGGLGALVDGVRPDSKGGARSAGHPLLGQQLAVSMYVYKYRKAPDTHTAHGSGGGTHYI